MPRDEVASNGYTVRVYEDGSVRVMRNDVGEYLDDFVSAEGVQAIKEVTQ